MPEVPMLTGLAVAACTVLLVLGSSSSTALGEVGRPARWFALAMLWVISVAAALRQGVRWPVGSDLALSLFGSALALLAIESLVWSGDAALTFKHAAAFAVVVSLAAAIAVNARRDERVTEAVAAALLYATCAVMIGGFVLIALAPADAGEPNASPWRLRGLGENPNTVSMLVALTLPLALTYATQRSPRRLAVVYVYVVLAFATIALSGSRGALVAAVLGGLVTAACLRSRSTKAVVAAVVLAGGLASAATFRLPITSPVAVAPPQVASQYASSTLTSPASSSTSKGQTRPRGSNKVRPHSHGSNHSSGGQASGGVSQPSGAVTTPTTVQLPTVSTTPGARSKTPRPGQPGAPPLEVGNPYGALSDEVGLPQHRSFFTSSGRVQAWQAAISQGNERPAFGYGFGTESRVFFDRFQVFEASYVENSFIGLYLQLGLAGVVALALLVVILLVVAVHALRRRVPVSPIMPALVGVVAAGLVMMCVQSYVYSPGNVATVPLWASGGLLAAGAGTIRMRGFVSKRSRRMAIGVSLAALLAFIPLGRWEHGRAVASTGRAMTALWKIPGPEYHAHFSGGRLANGYDCLLFRWQRYPPALEFCFSPEGYLAEAIDRRAGRTPRFLSLRDEPSASPVRMPLPWLLRQLHRADLLDNVRFAGTQLPVAGGDYPASMLKSALRP